MLLDSTARCSPQTRALRLNSSPLTHQHSLWPNSMLLSLYVRAARGHPHTMSPTQRSHTVANTMTARQHAVHLNSTLFTPNACTSTQQHAVHPKRVLFDSTARRSPISTVSGPTACCCHCTSAPPGGPPHDVSLAAPHGCGHDDNTLFTSTARCSAGQWSGAGPRLGGLPSLVTGSVTPGLLLASSFGPSVLSLPVRDPHTMSHDARRKAAKVRVRPTSCNAF